MIDKFYSEIQKRMHDKEWSREITNRVICEYNQKKQNSFSLLQFFHNPSFVTAFVFLVAICMLIIVTEILPDSGEDLITFLTVEFDPLQNLIGFEN
jgi:hypothetical protein